MRLDTPDHVEEAAHWWARVPGANDGPAVLHRLHRGGEDGPAAVDWNHTADPKPGTGLVCPVCGRAAPRVLRGQELQLVAMEVPA